MADTDRRLSDSLERLNEHLQRLQASNARLRAQMAQRPPHELYAIAARLDAEAARTTSDIGARQAARWEHLADAVIAP